MFEISIIFVSLMLYLASDLFIVAYTYDYAWCWYEEFDDFSKRMPLAAYFINKYKNIAVYKCAKHGFLCSAFTFLPLLFLNINVFIGVVVINGALYTLFEHLHRNRQYIASSMKHTLSITNIIAAYSYLFFI